MYTINLIYGVSYTRNNQLAWDKSEDLPHKTVTVNERFNTHMQVVKVPRASLGDVSPAKVVGVEIIDYYNGNEDFRYFYFVNGYRREAAELVEFSLTPDYFHTYLNLNDEITGNLARTNLDSVTAKQAIRSHKQAAGIVTDYTGNLPTYNKLATSNKYYVCTLLAAQNAVIATINKEAVYATQLGQIVVQNQRKTKYVTVNNSNNSLTDLPAKPLRILAVPSELAETIANNNVSDLFTYYLANDKGEERTEVISIDVRKSGTTISYNKVCDPAKVCRVGTMFDNVEIKNNVRFTNDFPKVRFNINVNLYTFALFLEYGDENLDITRGFEIDVNTNETGLYYAQHGVSDAIQKVGGVVGAISGVVTGSAAIATGQYVQGATSFANSAMSVAKMIGESTERKNLITATAGNNVGYLNIFSPWGGLALVEYDTINTGEIREEIGTVGFNFFNAKTTVTLNEVSVVEYNYIEFSRVELPQGIPPDAYTDIEAVFLNGFFIKRYEKAS